MGQLTRAARKSLPLAQGDFWPQDYVAGNLTINDPTVNGDTSMNVSAYFGAVRDISEDMAKMPLKLFRTTAGPGGRARREEARDHPTYRVLHDVANPEMTAFVFREIMQGHLLTWGNCYAEKQVDGSGFVIALWPLRPDRMQVKRVNGVREYRYRLPGNTGEVKVFSPDKIFHVPGFGFDGTIGYSILTVMRKALGLSLATQEYGERTFINGARPGVVLKHPKGLTDIARKNIEESWARNHEGLSNAQRTAILEEGMDLVQVAFTPEDAQFLATRTFQIGEIARYTRMPLHKLNELTRATFSNIEQQAMEYVTDTLGGWAGRWESQIGKDIVPEPDVYAKHMFNALLRGDTLARFQAYNIARMIGVLSANDILELEDRNPREDPGGDEYLVPLNMVEEPGGGPTTPPGEGPAAAGSTLRVVRTAIDHRTTREATA